MYKRMRCGWDVVLFSVVPGATVLAGSGDVDSNGYIDLRDYGAFRVCLAQSGPDHDVSPAECPPALDADDDGDIDLRDFSTFQRARGHLPFPLRDTFGNAIHVDSTVPYSGQKTCGANACHDIARITNGVKFQEGRTDAQGNIIMREDYYGDGRYWIRGGGRYGRSIPIGTDRILSPKQGARESDMDMSTFGWIGECSACHTGGGPGEFDRDGVRLFDPPTGRFGYEALGKTAEDVALDGDYTDLNPATGNLSLARWDITGLSEPDCLFCHTPDPRWKNNPSPYNRVDYKRLDWRSATLATKTNLVDNSGNPVPAYAAAGPAGQGWFSGSPPTTANPKLQIDYSVGVNLGTLAQAPDGVLNLVAQSVDRPPRDVVCWPCHDSSKRRRGDPWFDERIVHYARWNKLTDDDPSNDVPIYKSRGCNYCHPGNLDHNFAKGNNPGNVFRDELDWVNFRSCRDCHMPLLSNGQPNPRKHPDAPDVPGSTLIHLVGDPITGRGPFDIVSCQGCHIPYPLSGPGISTVQDGSVTGTSVAYPTDVFYSADPLNPSDPDKSRWYAGLDFKEDSDGVTRLFPFVQNQRLYWGDWDQKGTPDDRSDDIIAPIALWRFRQITGGNPLPVVTDDNGDGKPEINRDEEILAYITALKGVDSYGRQVAANPVYLKAFRVWYEDPQAPGGVSSFDPVPFGIKVEFGSGKGLSHGVQPKEFALGYNAVNPELGCRDCHRPATLDSPVFDRKILVDPWGPDGRPVYTTVRQLTGLNPP
jgi:hypothetical protein